MTKNTKKKLSKSPQHKPTPSKTSLQQTFIRVNASVEIAAQYSKENQDKIIALIQKQTEHIIHIENELLAQEKQDREIARETIKEQIKFTKRGQIFAGIFVIFGFIFGFIFAFLGIEIASFASLLISVATLIAQFLPTRKN